MLRHSCDFMSHYITSSQDKQHIVQKGLTSPREGMLFQPVFPPVCLLFSCQPSFTVSLLTLSFLLRATSNTWLENRYLHLGNSAKLRLLLSQWDAEFKDLYLDIFKVGELLFLHVGTPDYFLQSHQFTEHPAPSFCCNLVVSACHSSGETTLC